MSDDVSDVLADLAGKFFHHLEHGLVVQRGTVVGTSYPGVYLLEFWDVLAQPAYQELVMIETMISTDERVWRFYDDKEWADRDLPLDRSAGEGRAG